MKPILITLTTVLMCVAAFGEVRTWTMSDDKVFEAEFITAMGDKFVFKTPKGKQVKIPKTAMSKADIDYISIANPPQLSVDFVKSETPFKVKTSLVFNNELPPKILYYNFGAKTKQKSAGSYPHQLEIEYFAFAREIFGNRYILMDRAKETFSFTRENNLSFAFRGEREVPIIQYTTHNTNFGTKYAGNLVTITDVRGTIIAHNASQSWMLDAIENIKKLPIGAYCDKTGARRYPTPPRPWY